ncbi:MAG: choice-of-anchor D domain-containing protein [Verrucomicrobiaceae bacterium]|nr:choice-of-anchor D domain-containing protein [Verrucomicrobiaceae bacterium]
MGAFSTVGGVSRQYHAKLLFNGSVDTATNLQPSGGMTGMAVGPDDKLYFFGAFSALAGANRKMLARSNLSGVIEPAPNYPFDTGVYSVGFLRQGGALFGGGFIPNSLRLFRITASGDYDQTFAPTLSNSINCMVPTPQGRFLVAGVYQSGAQTYGVLQRVFADGTVDSTFTTPSFSDAPGLNCMALQADGRILIGGSFSQVHGIARSNLARLMPDGSLDTSFNPAPNAAVNSIALQTDGKILLGGAFNTVAGVSQTGVVRLNADGTRDASFSVTIGNFINGLTIMDSGAVLVCGGFTVVNGVTRRYVALLNNDNISQTLSVPTAGRVQWLRGGASPEAAQVVFELSTDGGTAWSQLGYGSRITGGWQLASLVLPSSGMIRARALVTCGQRNSSISQYQTTTTFSGLAPVAEIAVEQPIGSGLENGFGTTDFGSANRPDHSTRTVRIRNVGSAALTGIGAAVIGIHASDFTLQTTLPSSLAAGASVDVDVKFTPSIFGSRTATLQIASDDADEPIFEVALVGTGLSPEIGIQQPSGTDLNDGASTVSFGSWPASAYTSRTFTLINNGNSALTGISVTVDGHDAADFTVTTVPPATLDPGNSATFAVRFLTRSVLGTKTAGLHLISSDLDENPFDVALTAESTSPTNDADGDGLSDHQEFWLGTSMTQPDTDGDGINDGQEYNAGMNPLSLDSDGDGMTDAYEWANGLNSARNDTGEDVDFDFVTNLQEFTNGTKANNALSGTDGISDYRRINGKGTWKAYYDRNNRFLGQLFDNGMCLTQGYDANSNPTRQIMRQGADYDHDGLLDLWEIANGLNPNSASGADGVGDADSDGLTNIQEFIAGTDPKSANAKTTNDGSVIATSSAFPFTPTNYVMACGQLDGTGIEEVVISGDGDPGAATNVLRIFTPNATGTVWTEETVNVGNVGVTSICIGHTNAANTIFIGTRAVAPAFGQVIKFVKTAGVWTPTVMVSSTDQVAFVAGYSDWNSGKLVAQYSATITQRLYYLDVATATGNNFSGTQDMLSRGPRFARDGANGIQTMRHILQSGTNYRLESRTVGSNQAGVIQSDVFTSTTALVDSPQFSVGVVGLSRHNYLADFVQYRLRDMNNSGTADLDDDCSLVEALTSGATRTQVVSRLFQPSSMTIATGTVFPSGPSTASVLLTGDADGVVSAWSVPSLATQPLSRRLLSGAHRGKVWHDFRSLRGIGTGDSAAGLAISPTTPTTPQIVVWSADALRANNSAPVQQTAPMARIASTPIQGTATSPVDVDLWDAEGNTARVLLQYRPNGWSAWANASVLSLDGGSATSFVSAPPSGSRHHLLWDAAADLGAAFTGDVLLRTRATDAGDAGAWSEQMVYTVGVASEIAVTDTETSTALTDGLGIVALGDVAQGQPVTRTFTISNGGNGDLTGLNVTSNATGALGLIITQPTSTTLATGGSTTFSISLTPSASGSQSFALQIASNDADENPFDIPISLNAVPQVLTLALAPSAVLEDGSGNLLFTLTRSATAGSLTAGYTLSGTAAEGSDYSVASISNVTFAPGSATATVVIDPTADTVAEPDETVTLTLSSSAAYSLGTPSAFTGTILNDELPTLTTTLASNVTATDALSGGNVTSDGGSPITQRGIVFAISQNPTTTTGNKVIVPGTTGSYTAALGGLSPATTYYVRAFATSSAGTAYGTQVQFTTGIVPVGPGWQSPTGLEHSMTVYAQVDRQGTEVTTAGSKLAAFDSNGNVAGVASVITGPGGSKLYQLTVWSNQTSIAAMPLKVYDAGTDEVKDIIETLAFQANGILGTIAAPVLYHVRPPEIDQLIPLVQGWNWISFNALPQSHAVGTVLAQHSTAQDNDLIKGTTGTATFYGGVWYPSAGFTLEGGQMYMLRKQQSGSVSLTVTGQAEELARSIPLVPGWNWLGYLPQTALPVATALQNISLSDNDLIKGQYDGSATWFSGSWFPSTYQLTPGRGYLLKVTTAQSFSYDGPPVGGSPSPSPLPGEEDSGSAATGSSATSAASSSSWQAPTGKENSATIYAVVEIGDLRLEQNDAKLAIFENGQVAGVASISQGPTGKLYQLTAWSDNTNASNLSLQAYDPSIQIVRDLAPGTNITANGIQGSIVNPVLFTAPALTPIELWRHTHFGNIRNEGIGSDLADDDNDGSANLLEYASAMAPKSRDHLPITCSKPGDTIEFTFTKNLQATDVTMSVEWSDTLGNDWSGVGVNYLVLSDDGATQQIKAVIPAGSSRRFAHLKITRP